MSERHRAAPLAVPLWTPGVLVLVALMIPGFVFVVARFVGGLGAVTNLSQTSPWGIWVAIDVATGVALAAGGFTTAALAHVFGRQAYETITRPALLTAMLGYTFVPIALMIDIGRYWAIWHPIIYWQGNSVLFEVAMCVVIYTNVLYIEFLPIVAERYKHGVRLPGPLSVLNGVLEKFLQVADRTLDRVMWVFILAGVVLSCMHQSGLGSLMLIAPTKLHALWYTPILPLLFLISAVAVGFPMVIFENVLASASLPIEDETPVLSQLSRYTFLFIGIYGVLKIGDLLVRGTYRFLFEASAQSFSFLVEIVVGVFLPFVLLGMPTVRRSRRGLFISACLIIAGVVLNRLNVFLVGYRSPYAVVGYWPSIGELAVTTALTAAIVFLYRVLVTYLPVLPPRIPSHGTSLGVTHSVPGRAES
ncbi:NrfD/PsrC family molybdoenzyme membrane anchor subunit [Desulfosoma caldarium]|uniref:Ni/Fe-hydrogenase subunit HybB-like protein n=1 Tax=Desulfosoma caldarium TaxID=610254 RepID=A0A3N1UEJ1_9BACT|nr:Ni/Fe-hydrogenase cytochrome b subunit [Desulfosoma caldarium]ROQ89822.1 Ni/Fe-hydrogenase subunit HybB-like protein [Desulfosoma caldarium]